MTVTDIFIHSLLFMVYSVALFESCYCSHLWLMTRWRNQLNSPRLETRKRLNGPIYSWFNRLLFKINHLKCSEKLLSEITNGTLSHVCIFQAIIFSRRIMNLVNVHNVEFPFPSIKDKKKLLRFLYHCVIYRPNLAIRFTQDLVTFYRRL